MEIVTIYDELDRPYVCEVEGSRILRVISGPKQEPEPVSRFVRYSDPAILNDVRFGE